MKWTTPAPMMLAMSIMSKTLMMSKMLTISSISVFLLASVLPAAAESPVEQQAESAGDPARALFLAGRNLWDEGRFAEAEQKFREALSKYPHSEQADRIGFYHIETLTRMGRSREALDEMNTFLKDFPQSKWWGDVQEKWIGMTGEIPRGLMGPGRGWGGPGGRGGPDWAYGGWDAGLAQELLRALLANDAERAIGVMKDRLKTDPADSAVLANLNAVISAKSAQALPFLISVARSSSSPKSRAAAVYWLGRVPSDKDSSALKALAEITRADADKSVRAAAAQALAPSKDPLAVDALAAYLKDPANK